jgi:hypothetical protein
VPYPVIKLLDLHASDKHAVVDEREAGVMGQLQATYEHVHLPPAQMASESGPFSCGSLHRRDPIYGQLARSAGAMSIEQRYLGRPWHQMRGSVRP